MERESTFKRKLMRVLLAIPRSYFRRVEQKAIVSTPDICGVVECPVCKHGRAVFLEAKRVGKKPTPAQEAELEMIREAGGFADVIRPDNVAQIIDDIRKLGEE